MTEIKVNTENMRTTANAFQDKIDEWKGLVTQRYVGRRRKYFV